MPPPPKHPQRPSQHRIRAPYPNDVDFSDIKAVSREYEDTRPTYSQQPHWTTRGPTAPPPPQPYYYPNPYVPPPNPAYADPRTFPQNWGGNYHHQYPQPAGVVAPNQPYHQQQPSSTHLPSSQSHHRSASSRSRPPPPSSGGHTPYYPSNHQLAAETPRGHTTTNLNTQPASTPMMGSHTPQRRDSASAQVDESPGAQLTRRNTAQNRHVVAAPAVSIPRPQGQKPDLVKGASANGTPRTPRTTTRNSIQKPTLLPEFVTLPSGYCMIEYNIAFSPSTARKLTGNPKTIANDITAASFTDFVGNMHGPLMRRGALELPSEKVKYDRQLVHPPVKHLLVRLTSQGHSINRGEAFSTHYGPIGVHARNEEAVTVEDLFRSLRLFFNKPISPNAFDVLHHTIKPNAEAMQAYRKNTSRFFPEPEDPWRVPDEDCRIGKPRVLDAFNFVHRFGGLKIDEEASKLYDKLVLVLLLIPWDYGQLGPDSDDDDD